MERRVVQQMFTTGNGKYIDGSLFYEQKSVRRRNARFRPSSEAQQRLNEDNARRYAIRLVQENFRPGVDFIVHPTYNTLYLPDNSDRVKKDMRNYLLKIKRLYSRLGINCEFKYFGSAVGDGKIRKHLHIIITGSKYPNLADEISRLWQYGTCNVDRVQSDENDGLSGIAAYICENHRAAKDCGENIFAKRWCCSKNLIKPEARERRGKLPVAFLPKIANATPYARIDMIEEIFPGYKAVEVDVAELKDAPEERKHRIFGNYYIYIRLVKKEPKKAYPTRR